ARNRGQRGYRPKQADTMAQARRSRCKNAQRLTAEDWHVVDECLKERLSPEQISGRLKLSGRLQISPETIYKHVYQNKALGGQLIMFLRGQKPYRKRYGSGQERRGMIRNRVSIEKRPAVVDEKTRIGDWEGDTIIGKAQQGVIVTLTE